MKQCFSPNSKNNEPLESYETYKANTMGKAEEAIKGLLTNILSCSLNSEDKKKLMLKIKQIMEQAFYIDLPTVSQ